MRLIPMVAVVVLPILVGCVGEDPFAPSQRPAKPEAVGVSTDTVETAGQPAAKPAAKPQPQAQPAAAPAVRRKAAPGVTGKGNYGGGIITTPVSVYFRAQERIIFNIQIPEALKLYKATNEHAPKSHQEFMEKVIKANQITLPELRPGDRYLYDPQKEELFVVRQKR